MNIDYVDAKKIKALAKSFSGCIRKIRFCHTILDIIIVIIPKLFYKL